MQERQAKYMPGTKFEMKHFDGPDDMHRCAMMELGIGLNWTREGDENDPDNYTESFEIIDGHGDLSQKGLTRQQCEEIVWGEYWDEQCK